MRALAGYIMHGRVQAISAVAGLALLSLIVAPLTLLTTAAVALVTLVQGYREGLLNLLVATLVVAVTMELMMGRALVGLEYAIKYWIPAWLFASVLLYRTSLAFAVVFSGVLAGLVVVGAYLSGDPASMWYEVITKELLPVFKEAGMVIPQEVDAEKVWRFMSQLMTGSAMALFLILHVASLFTARWWQAQLYNPGGFADEFRQLRLGFNVAVGGLLIVVVAMVTTSEIARNLLFVVVSLFLFQGLAVVHALVAKCKLGTAWLVGVYIVMAFTLTQGAIGVLLVSTMGLIDNWVNFRDRMCASKTHNDMS